jgi:hypothetical protein
MIRIAVACLALIVASAAAAQDYSASGGELHMLPKTATNQFSGTLGFSFATGGAKTYNGTFGGAAIPDRLHFFGSVERFDGRSLQMPGSAMPAMQTPSAPMRSFDLPTSFLNMRTTGTPSSNSLFTVSFSAAKP